jgi:hypothetical protein
MASKPVPAKKKSTSTKSTTTPTNETQEASITTIRQSTCKNLQGTATLTYHIGRDDKVKLHWKIDGNTGAGMFSNNWVPLDDIQKVLADRSEKLLVTSPSCS